MKVIEFIKRKGIEALKEELLIEVKEYPDRYVLNYGQIESPKYDEVVRECRGLILSKNLEILCRPFDRFYNLTEDSTKDFDITKAICWKKLDGSMLNGYHDTTSWQLSTRSTAFGEALTHMENSFKSCFEKCVGKTVAEFFEPLCRDYTYTFEYTSPENRVVTRYSEPAVYLLNARHKVSGLDVSVEELKALAKKLGVKLPDSYTFNSFDEIKEVLKSLPALDEGYVCYIPDIQWRLKVKNPSYLAVAHLRYDGVLSTKRVVYLVIMQEHEEYLSYFEEDLPLFQPYIDAFNYMKSFVYDLFEKTKHIEDRKEYAYAVKGPGQHILFRLKDGDTLTKVIEKMTDNGKERCLESFKKHMENQHG